MEKFRILGRRIVRQGFGPILAMSAYAYTLMPSCSLAMLEAYKAANEIQGIYRMDSNSEEMPSKADAVLLNLKLIGAKEKILKDMKIEKSEKIPVTLFLSKKFDIDHIGSINNLFSKGCLVGLPLHFNVFTEKGFTFLKTKLCIGVPAVLPFKDAERVPVDWNSDVGKIYGNSFKLSMDAIRFAIAREIYQANNTSIADPVGVLRYFTVLIGVIGVQSMWYLGIKQTLPVVMPISVCVAVMYTGLKNLYDKHLDKKVEKEVAALGPEYLHGGMEYYTKQIQRNKAMRYLLGKKGEKLFTVYGNEITPFYKIAPIFATDKLKMLKEIELSMSSSASSSSSEKVMKQSENGN